MGFEIKVTGSTKEELIDAVNELTQIMVLPVWQPTDTSKPAKTTQAPEAKPKKRAEPDSRTDPKAKELSLKDLREALSPMLQEKREEIKEMFNEFGVKKISELAATDRQAFLEKVKAL